jgi:hypothetical protein
MQVTTTYQRLAGTTAFAVTDALNYYLYVVNDDSSSKPLVVNVAKWGPAPVGGTVLINQVSTNVLTAVVAKLILPASKVLKFTQVNPSAPSRSRCVQCNNWSTRLGVRLL